MSTIKVNTIENRTGSSLTLGKSGTTIQLACGATQTGFGRTGTVNWCTTAKTSPLTVESGKGYFINTTSGVITVTLPASPSAGDIVAFKDYANTWDTNNVTIARNGSKINGSCGCATLSTESQSVTLIYVDATKGWQDIHDSTSNVTGESFICASGGNSVATACTNYKVHTFTSSGTFTVNSGIGAKATVSYLVVAGGGAGGKDRSGGGGAGGFREGRVNTSSNPDTYSVSPLAATTGIQLSPGTFPVTVGAGGATIPAPAPASGTPVGSGTVSTFSTITSAGGGGGGSGPGPFSTGRDGGSGGGSDAYGYPSSPGNMAAGSGNTPPVSPPQGNNGGVGVYNSPNGSGRGGGGGGATAVGTGGTPGGNPGGAGATTSINATPTAYAGGGAGSTCASGAATGGAGGGGNGGSDCSAATDGTANRGGGGGGGNGGTAPNSTLGANGGSGIVIIRYKFQ